MRLALGIEYSGTHYHGWQAQSSVPSVQTHLENALHYVANHKIEVTSAGRTDAGVHAIGQIVHFDTDIVRPDKAWLMGVNTQLPNDIRVRWVKVMNSSFHARFSATARRYIYLIDNRRIRSAIWHDKALWFFPPLVEQVMDQAAQALIGENNFAAFQAASCQSNTSMRCIMHCQVRRQEHWVWIDIKANAFLHHMVRNIVGSLLWVGSGVQSVGWFTTIFKGQDRKQAGPTALPMGLYLVDVDYPVMYEVPISDSSIGLIEIR